MCVYACVFEGFCGTVECCWAHGDYPDQGFRIVALHPSASPLQGPHAESQQGPNAAPPIMGT